MKNIDTTLSVAITFDSDPGWLVPRNPGLHGSLNRKKLAGCEALIGMAFEKAPAPSSVPALFVIQLIGGVRLVVTSQV